MVRNRPNSNDGSSTVNCNESDSVVDTLIDNIHDLQERVSELEKTVSEQQNTIDSLENELADYRESNERDKALIKQDVSEVSGQSENNFQLFDTLNQKVKSVKGDLKRTVSGKTALEQILQLPTEVARDSLSKNQWRARKLVRSIGDVDSKNTMKGLVIDSRSVKKWLTETCGSGYDQTVKRVMDFIGELGESRVEVTKRNGRRLMAIDTEYVTTLNDVEELDAEAIESITRVVRPTTGEM